MWSTKYLKTCMIAKLTSSFHRSVWHIILAVLKSALIFVVPQHSHSSLFLAYVVILVNKQDNQTALHCLVKDVGHVSATSRTDWAGQMPPVLCRCHFLRSFFIMSHNLTSIQSFKPWHTHTQCLMRQTEWIWGKEVELRLGKKGGHTVWKQKHSVNTEWQTFLLFLINE